MHSYGKNAPTLHLGKMLQRSSDWLRPTVTNPLAKFLFSFVHIGVQYFFILIPKYVNATTIHFCLVNY